MARFYSTARYGAGYEILNVARTLAETGTFGDPYLALRTGPTAHVAPLYPMFLALFIKLFGYGAIFVILTSGLVLVMHGLHAMLMPRVSELFFERAAPGYWAAILSILLPVFPFLPQFELMYDAVGLMLFCLAAARYARSPSTWRALGIGALAGVLALLNPANLTVAALWLAYVIWRERASIKPAVWMVAAAIVIVAPWTVRNYVQLHQFVPIRDNLGVELYIANNDMARPSFFENMPSFLHRHPAASLDEARAVREMGEAAYSESRRAIAESWIRTHPARFFELASARAKMFWFSDDHDSVPQARSILFVTVMSVAGLVLLVVRRDAIAIFIAAVWLLYPLIYYVVQHDPRYRMPILWMTLLPAGYAISAASAKLRKLWQFRM